ncbi:hypothetical protein LTR94_038497, partial [Friedmanniomyces endolithicus]
QPQARRLRRSRRRSGAARRHPVPRAGLWYPRPGRPRRCDGKAQGVGRARSRKLRTAQQRQLAAGARH